MKRILTCKTVTRSCVSKNATGVVNGDRLIRMLDRFGFYAEVLPDDYPVASGLLILDLNHHSILN
jgi:hypothetical protein